MLVKVVFPIGQCFWSHARSPAHVTEQGKYPLLVSQVPKRGQKGAPPLLILKVNDNQLIIDNHSQVPP